MLYALSTGIGDGSLNVGVDGYGAFGGAVSAETNEARYDPIGPIGPAGTTFASGVAIRIGDVGTRQFLTSGSFGGSGGLPAVSVTGTTTVANSNFSLSGLAFALQQSVTPIFDSFNVQTGSLLSQRYEITNTTSSTINFELIRYFDGDLLFDGSLVDGGGRLVTANGQEILFETDAGGSGATDTTFIGITGDGGTIPSTGRFEIESYSTLQSNIIQGLALDGLIRGDLDGNGFVDAGREYDITLGLRNVFSLAPGDRGVYFTRTVFGSGIPDELELNLPEASIADASVLEGDAGLTSLVFSISLSETPNSAITVTYVTEDGTAQATSDYLARVGTVTFMPDGPTTQTITIQVVGDTDVEDDETFSVRITEVVGGDFGRSVATGTILNDDVDLVINDLSVVEPNTGTLNAVFTVTAIGRVNRTITASYATADLTATAGSDYLSRGGTVTLPRGATSANITVPIVGDQMNEASEQFLVLLGNPANARIRRATGIGTIIDNDPIPGLYVNDVYVTSIFPDTLAAVFAVALDSPSGRGATVSYSTSDGDAVGGVDYVPQTGILTFAPGVRTQLVTVPVMTSGNYEGNERFYLNLFSPVNAQLVDPRGIGTIVFAPPPVNEFILDDGAPGYSQTSGWTTVTNTLAHQLDYAHAPAGNGSQVATWRFNSIPNGSYEVFARWIPFGNRATNAPFTILDDTTPRGTVLVNQQLNPGGDLSNGITWKSLGRFEITNNNLVVRLTNNANGFVIADAIRIVGGVSVQYSSEIDVSGNERAISTGSTTTSLEAGTNFGNAALLSDGIVRTFTIANTGNADLHLTGQPPVSILGANAADFSVIAPPPAVILPGRTATFKVMFHPSELGLREAIVSIASNDANESPYTFRIEGNGTPVGPGEIVADNSSASFQASGLWTSTPSTQAVAGQMLTSSGPAQAEWHFDNLAPGKYEVYASWLAAPEHAIDAPFTISDGSGAQYSRTVDQRQAPAILIGGTRWGSLGTVEVTSGAMSVSLSDAATGKVVADAVMIIRQGALNAPAAHNLALPGDVNGDNRISAVDALLVINRLNTATAEPTAEPLVSASATSTYFVDVNGDGRVTAIDALLVINRLLATSAPTAGPSAAAPEAPNPMLALAAIDQAIDQLSAADELTTSPSFSSVPTVTGEKSSRPLRLATVDPLSIWEAVESPAEDEDAGEEAAEELG